MRYLSCRLTVGFDGNFCCEGYEPSVATFIIIIGGILVLYIYNKTSIKRNILIIKQYTSGVGRAKDISAPRYNNKECNEVTVNSCKCLDIRLICSISVVDCR